MRRPRTIRWIIGLFALGLVGLLVFRSFLIVDETEFVLVTEFGRTVDVLGDEPDEAGLHAKWPWQSSIAVDRRLRVFDPPPREMITGDKRNLEVASYVAWRVGDPVRFVAAAGTLDAAEARLNERISAALSDALGRRELASLASTDPKVWRLDALTGEVLEAVAPLAKGELGVEVLDVRLRRFNHPVEVRPAVFDLIRSERKQVAATLRAEGEAQYQTLTSQADRERDAILSRADAEAERLRGRGDAEATRLLNEAHARDPKFYEFVRTLETYRAILDDRATLVLSSASALEAPPAHQGTIRRTPSRGDASDRREGGLPLREQAMNRRYWIIGGALLLVAVLAYLASGWRTVAPGEVVVVRRLGRVLPEPWGPGPHWAWPLGIDRLSRLRLDEVRRLEFGRIEIAGPMDPPGAGEYLTGDLNFVRARGVVQYRVSDPVAFVLRAEDARPDAASGATEASLARALASRGIDAISGAVDRQVAADVQETELARSVDSLGLGVAILGVNLTDARPPIEVEPAFAEAQAAQSERDRRINEGQALAGTLRPAALAVAEGSTDAARTKAARDVEMARSRADRFLTLLAEADRSRPLTVRRLYRDALRDLLPRVRRKVLMTPEEPVDLGIIGSGPK